eukprot:363353-Chlamydomonas_euryale.AAC.17
MRGPSTIPHRWPTPARTPPSFAWPTPFAHSPSDPRLHPHWTRMHWVNPCWLGVTALESTTAVDHVLLLALTCQVRPAPGGIALYATRHLSAGEPLLLCYGQLSNDFLFMDYGFVVPNNPHDRVTLRFGIDLLQVRVRRGARHACRRPALREPSCVCWCMPEACCARRARRV